MTRKSSSYRKVLGFAPLLLGLVPTLSALGISGCTVTEEKTRKPDGSSAGGVGGGAGTGGTAPTGSGGSPATVTPHPEAGTAPPPDASVDAARSDGADATGGAVISGRLTVSDLLFVDGDVANPEQTPKSNDALEDAQIVGSPGLVGGYLGGSDGVDVYKVELGGNEALTLYIAAPAQPDPSVPVPMPDFDLVLYDADGNTIDQSAGTGPVEMLKAPAPGTYLIGVWAADGTVPGLYTLSIASSPSAQAVRTAARDKLNPAWPLVAGEALVKLRPRADAAASVFGRLGIRPLSSGQNAVGYYRVALAPPGGTKTTGTARVHDASSTLLAIKALRHSPEVLYAEPNYKRTIHAAPPNDPLFSYQWHYRSVNLLDAWDHTKGAGTVVAVLDTGAKKAHPDFRNADSSSQLLAGYDMIADVTEAADGNGRDADSDDPGDRDLATDSSWHGSHVSGTIAAATDNSIGCAGIAPAAKVLPVRVLGVGGGTVDDIVEGILYAAHLTNDAGVLPARASDVINMSLGGPGLSQATADAIALARDAGTVVVASAGNDNTDASFYSPAGEAGVVTVSAVDLLGQKASYSNYGNVIDVAAPGGDETTDENGDGVPDGVLSLVYSNNGKTLYQPYEGTSMASPHVSGIIALMKSVYPAMTPDIVDAMLAGTAGVPPITQDVGTKGLDDEYGYGLLNANLGVLSALQAASKPTTSTPLLQLSTTNLDFGPIDVSRTFDITNAGRGTLTVTSTADDQPWITVTPGALGTNTVAIDRTGLASGVYSGTITVVTNGGTQTVAIRMTVASASVVPGGDVGVVYVLLVDPTTNDVVAETRTSLADGYAFSFEGEPDGDYDLVAGTDLDDSGIVNDDGEAFGAYPVTSDPRIVHVGKSQTDLNFPLRFQFQVQAASTGRHSLRRRFAH